MIKNIFYNRDILQYIMTIAYNDRDIETMISLKYVNSKTWNLSRILPIYHCLWIRLGLIYRNRSLRSDIMNNILDLLLRDIKITPYPHDIRRMVDDPRFNRISSREILTWPGCLDEIIPDPTPGGNNLRYYIGPDKIDELFHLVSHFLCDNFWVTKTPMTTVLNTAILLDDMCDQIYENMILREDDTIWWAYYSKYHLYDTDLDDLITAETNFTLLLNKIKLIYNYMECYIKV